MQVFLENSCSQKIVYVVVSLYNNNNNNNYNKNINNYNYNNNNNNTLLLLRYVMWCRCPTTTTV